MACFEPTMDPTHSRLKNFRHERIGELMSPKCSAEKRGGPCVEAMSWADEKSTRVHWLVVKCGVKMREGDLATDSFTSPVIHLN